MVKDPNILDSQVESPSLGNFQRLADRSRDGIYHYDIRSGRFTGISQQFGELFNLTICHKEAVSVEHILQWVHPDDQGRYTAFFSQAINLNEDEGELEYRMVTSDGKLRWLEDRWILLRSPGDAKPLAIEGFVRDQTELRMADAQLRLSTQRALIGSYIVQDSRFNYVNPEFLRITGYSEDELLGTDPLAIVHEDYRDQVHKNAVSMLKGKSVTPYEFCIHNKNNQIRWIMETVTSISHEGRRAVLGCFMEITKLRRIQGNLSTLGLMIGTISHSLRGCLTGLDASLYLIETGFYRDMPARIEEGLDVTKLMVDRIRKLVLDILYYAKERDLELEQISAGQFALDLAAAVETRIRAANIRFITEIDHDLGMLNVDVDILRAAFVNILENAMEACIEDQRNQSNWIRFTARSCDKEVIFEFSDNGPGISKENLNQIFRLFYSSKGKKGTGIGLFVSRRVIRRHGGSIEVQSVPGQGARFSITLPRVSVKHISG
jgi:PAS domain S-box-containing protein